MRKLYLFSVNYLAGSIVPERGLVKRSPDRIVSVEVVATTLDRAVVTAGKVGSVSGVEVFEIIEVRRGFEVHGFDRDAVEGILA